MYLSPPPPSPQGGLGYFPFQGGGSDVVDSLFNVPPIVCRFFSVSLLCVLSSFAIILIGKRKLVVFLMSGDCLVFCTVRLWHFLIILTYFSSAEAPDVNSVSDLISVF